MIKKIILTAFAALAVPAMVAYAATPALTVTGGSDSNTVTVQVTGGEINAPVVLYHYSSANPGNVQSRSLGSTNINGTFSGTVSTADLGLTSNSTAYVQVGGYQSNSVSWPFTNVSGSGSVMFSQSSPTIGLGQNGTITLSGGNGSYYIASNSNTGGVTPSISGNTLTLYGSATGQASIVVCATGGGCGTIMTTVNNTGTTGAPSLSQSSLMVNQGSQGSITLSGGSAPYTISIPSGSGVSTTLIGNTLYVNGNATGTTMVNVCSQNGGACTPLSVNVQAQGQMNTNTGGQMSFTLPLTVGQPTQLMLSGGSGSYYLQSPMSSPALASISGNTLMLNGSAVGSGTVTVCQTGGSSCLPISFSVQPALTGTGGGYLFDTDLMIGMTSQDVMELQTRLKAEGYFTATPTGYFGPLTATAVRAYQSAHGISATGYVGALTRAELNR